MRKLIFAAALLSGLFLPMAPMAEAQQTIIVRPHAGHHGQYWHRGRWFNHRYFRRGRWHYW